MGASTQVDMQEYTVTLPKDVVDIVRAKVSSGKYASEGEFLEAAIVDTMLPVAASSQLEQWVQTEGARRLAHLKTHPETGISPEQMEAFLDEDDDAFAHWPELR